MPATPKGQRTRDEILGHAVDLASAEGLCGLTIGRMATELGMSKSGLFAHFGSKEGLQVATLERAAKTFEECVVAPTVGVEPGLDRLLALWERWRVHIEDSPYRGGCFFAAAGLEFDGRPGVVRDTVAELSKAWLDALAAEVRLARRLGQLRKGSDPDQIAFRLHGYVQEANWASQLLDDSHAFERARTAGLACLDEAATPTGRRTVRAFRRNSKTGAQS